MKCRLKNILPSTIINSYLDWDHIICFLFALIVDALYLKWMYIMLNDLHDC